MHIGVVFPQVEIGADPGAIRDYAQAVEAMGYTHILTFDHVLGANPERPGGWKGPYTYRHSFHEPFVLFGFLAAATRRVELVTQNEAAERGAVGDACSRQVRGVALRNVTLVGAIRSGLAAHGRSVWQ